MNKSELIDAMASDAGISKAAAKKAEKTQGYVHGGDAMKKAKPC